jgi:hypothetical protein
MTVAEPTTLCGVCGEAVVVTPSSFVEGSGGGRPTSIGYRYTPDADAIEYGVDFEWISFYDRPGGELIHHHAKRDS